MFGCHLSVPFQPCCGSSPRTNAWRFGGSSLVGDDGFYVGCFPLFGWKSPQVTRFCFVFVFFVCLERGSYPSTPVNLSIHLLALVDLYMHIKQIWGTKVTTVIQSHKSQNQKNTGQFHQYLRFRQTVIPCTDVLFCRNLSFAPWSTSTEKYCKRQYKCGNCLWLFETNSTDNQQTSNTK